MPICDAHCHLFSARFFETLAKDISDLPPGDAATTVPGRLGWDPPGTPETLADRWAKELDHHRVTRAALIASVPGDEPSVAAAVAKYPHRYVGFFMLDPTRDGAVARVEQALAVGLRVVCLFPAMHHYRIDDERVFNVVERMAARAGTGVFVHCGALSVGVRKKLGLPSPFDVRLGDPLGAYVLAAAFPSLPLIIPHFGAGFFREALMAADLAPNIYFDTSSSNSWIKYHVGLTLPEVMRTALAVVGPDRLLFGTDSSFFPRGWQRSIFDVQTAALDEIEVSETNREKIFGGNFEKVFGRV